MLFILILATNSLKTINYFDEICNIILMFLFKILKAFLWFLSLQSRTKLLRKVRTLIWNRRNRLNWIKFIKGTQRKSVSIFYLHNQFEFYEFYLIFIAITQIFSSISFLNFLLHLLQCSGWWIFNYYRKIS